MRGIKLAKGVGIVLLCLILMGCSSQARTLTAEEIDRANQALQPILQIDGKDTINPISHFLTSYYDHPEAIDLAQVLYHFPSEDNISEEEFQSLRRAENWPFGEEITLETMPVPIHRIPAESVEEALNRSLGISLEDLEGVEDEEDILYLEAYDAFYNFTSDSSVGFFVCERGEVNGDRVILYGEETTLTLEKVGEDYRILSHTQATT